MQIYISNKEIEQLAEGLIQVTYGKPPPKYIDVSAVAAYLKLTVVYESIAEDDPDKIGFVSDGKTPLSVYRDKTKMKALFPKDTIVLDRFLLEPQEMARHRFVFAHEISHVILGRADPLHTAACFNRVHDAARHYSLAELRERMTLNEAQANSMAASILMPRSTLTDAVHRIFHKKQIPVYGENVFLPDMKPALQKMTEEFGVSYTALFIQLRKYGLLEQRDMTEYFEKTAQNGGEANG